MAEITELKTAKGLRDSLEMVAKDRDVAFTELGLLQFKFQDLKDKVNRLLDELEKNDEEGLIAQATLFHLVRQAAK